MTTIFYPRTNILFEEVDSYDSTNSGIDQYHKYNLLDFVYDAPNDSNPPLGIYWTGVSGSSFTQNDLQDRGYTSDYSSALDSLNSIQLGYMGYWHSNPYGYSTILFNGSVDKYIANDGITEGTEYLTFAIFIDSQKLLQYGDSYILQIKDDNSGDDTITAYPNGSYWDASGSSHGLNFSVTLRGGTGDDSITGYIQDDYLYGDAGDDFINGRLGNDEIYGGEGTDTVVFGEAHNTVNLGTISIQDTGEGWDLLNSIENVKAGSGNDSITGNSSNNIINGETGTDTFIFSSNRKDYKITYFSSYLKIEDLRSGSPDGTDNLYSIEKLQFSELTYLTSDLFFNPDNHSSGNNYALVDIRDYDGNLHANSGSVSDELKNAYKYQGKLDVNNDGVLEAIYTNKVSGRWVTGKIDSVTGQIDYSDHGSGGGTRVVGIYDDPLIAVGNANGGLLHDGVTPAPAQFGATGHDRYLVVNGETIDRLALNSQVRFQNDLLNDNLTVKTSGDYDGDGYQEVYWKTNDGDVYLRSLMHADGNIQYANYQNQTQMSDYLTGHGYQFVISDIV